LSETVNVRRGSFVQSVDRALDILESFGVDNKELGVTEISRILGLHKSTVYGLLNTMENRGYIVQNPSSGKYRLGLKLFELGCRVEKSMDLKKITDYYLEMLRQETGETVHLAIMDSQEVVYIDKKEGLESMRMVSQVGKRLPLHCSAIGKVLFAYLDQDRIEKIINEKGLLKMTAKTITDPSLLKEELDEIKVKGYAIDNEEIAEGLVCVAAPIRNYSNEVIAAISVAGPKARIDSGKLEAVKESVLQISQAISDKLGYSG